MITSRDEDCIDQGDDHQGAANGYLDELEMMGQLPIRTRQIHASSSLSSCWQRLDTIGICNRPFDHRNWFSCAFEPSVRLRGTSEVWTPCSPTTLSLGGAVLSASGMPKPIRRALGSSLIGTSS